MKGKELGKREKKPVCAVTAAILPFLMYALLIIYVKYAHIGDSGGYEAVGLFFVIVPTSIIISFVLSVFSIARNERFRALALIDLIVFGFLIFMAVVEVFG